MKYSLKDVMAYCLERPDLWHQITATGTFSSDRQTIETSARLPIAPITPALFTPEVNPRLQEACPIPPDQWPIWAKVIAKFRRGTDTGLGDTVVHLIGDARSERFKKWFARKFGHSCGCDERQSWLNRLFLY